MTEYPIATDYLTYCIENKISIVFLKYGDGEYNCALNYNGHNCDNDRYTNKLSRGILNSFKYLVEKPNVLIGGWHNKVVCDYWQSLISSQIQWINYHSIIIDIKDFQYKNENDNLNNKIVFFKKIQDSSLNKIIICNKLLKKAEIFLKTNKMIEVPLNNWFDTQFYIILNNILFILSQNTTEPNILIFAAGMSSKVLIAELYKKYPNNIYLDFGSALDLLCTKRDSRGRNYTYDDLIFHLSSIIPTNNIWNNPIYDNLYIEAKTKLGIHLK